MTNKLMNTVAAGALFATAFATSTYAQSTTQPAAPATPQTQTMQPATPAPADNAQAPAPAPMTDTAQASSTSGNYLTEQAADQVSANTYIGQSVMNSANESIGDVNDLIMKKDGGIVAAVIGVGGFLGIGEKDVAVPIENITASQNAQDGSIRLTTSETTDSLKSAPEFKTLQMQSAEKAPAAGNGTMPADNSATSSTTAQ